jgi:transposase
VKTLLHADVLMHPGENTRYSFYETTSEYGGIRQKWVLVIQKRCRPGRRKPSKPDSEKLDVQTAKSFKKLLGLEFACENDAPAAAEHWAKNHPWYLFTGFTIAPVSRKVEGNRGRPRNDEERLIVYTIQTEF